MTPRRSSLLLLPLLLAACGDSTSSNPAFADLAGSWAEVSCAATSDSTPPLLGDCQKNLTLTIHSDGTFSTEEPDSGGVPTLPLPGGILEVHGTTLIASQGLEWEVTRDGNASMHWSTVADFFFGDDQGVHAATLVRHWGKLPELPHPSLRGASAP